MADQELTQCRHCLRIPEFPCPLCFGWGWVPSSVAVLYGLATEGEEEDVRGLIRIAEQLRMNLDRNAE